MIRKTLYITLFFTLFTELLFSGTSDSLHVIISTIEIKGNKQTKEYIVRREITFTEGDTLTQSALNFQIDRSKENLVKTSLFNYVTFNQTIDSPGKVQVVVLLEERWYTFPSVMLQHAERNFSEWLRNGDLSKTKYGGDITRHNFRGRNEKLKFGVLLGYTKEFTLTYDNIIFGDKKQHYAGTEIALLKDEELIYEADNNKPVRFKNEFSSLLERRKVTISYGYRPGYYNRHKVYLNYFRYIVDDTLSLLNPGFFNTGKTRLDELTIHYVFTQDKRDSKAYPLHGYKFEVFAEQTIGLNHDFVLSYIKPEFNLHRQIAKHFYTASAFMAKISAYNQQSYYHMKALGYDDNLRGYEPYIVDGQHFITIKNLVKAEILPTRISVLNFIPLKKFKKVHYAIYANAYVDLGYVHNDFSTPNNPLDNTLLASIGLGFDFVTYYDKVMRIEYSLNRDWVHGIYIHFTAPI